MKILLACFACIASLVRLLAVEPVPGPRAGTIDPSFQIEGTPDGMIRSIAPLPNGEVIVAGAFRSWDGQPAPGLVRLRQDGSRDWSFLPRLTFLDWSGLTGVWIQDDGRLLIAGGFTGLSDKPRRWFGRLLANGQDDPTFAGFVDGEVNDVAFGPDGGLFVVGVFKTLNGLAFPGLAKLFTNGQVDPSFQPPQHLTGTGISLRPLAGGDLLVAGLSAPALNPTIFGMVRLQPNGAVDPSYYLENPSFFARYLAPLPDAGTILVSVFAVNKLMPDGGMDRTFDLAPLSTFVPSLVRVLPDGRLLIARDNLAGPDGTPTRLLRLFSDGRVDASFQSDLEFTPDAAGAGTNGALYVTGSVSGTNGDERRLIRLYSNAPSAPPTVQWDGAQASFPASSKSALVRVIRDGDLTGTSVVHVTTRVEGEVIGFTPFRARVQFDPGETVKTIAFPGVSAAQTNAEQRIYAELQNPTGAALGTNSIFVLRLVQDQGLVSFVTPSVIVSEPAGSVTVQFQREGALSYPVRWTWTIQSESADPEAYFTPTNGSLLLTPGSTNTYLSINLADNPSADGTKNFELRMGSVSRGFGLSGATTCPIRVLENDQPGFPGDGIDGPVRRLVEQSDGRVLLLGAFHSVHGRRHERLARLFSDGALDDAFQASFAFPEYANPAQDLELGPDGKMFVSGAFTNVNGLAQTNLAKLNADGTLDPSFGPTPNLRTQPTDIAATADGDLLAIGDGADFNGARGRLSLGAIAKFNASGSRDTNFSTTTFGGSESRLFTLPNSRFLAAGSIVVYSNALPAGRTTPRLGTINPVLRRNLARFESNGALDLTFDVTFLGAGGTRRFSSLVIADVFVQNDGRILVAGGFTNVNGRATPGLVRLLPNGQVDETFRAEIGRVTESFTAIRSVSASADQKIAVVVEDFYVDVRLIRLHPDGKWDSAFGVHRTTDGSTVVATLPNGAVWWAGNFLSVDHFPRFSLARFHSDGSLAPDGALGLSAIMRNGSGVCQWRLESRVGGQVRIEKSSDLKTWSPVLERSILSGLTEQKVELDSAPAGFFRAVLP